MAPLNSFRADGRGQLLLVGAFVLAILLVALAVVLNTAIYTETVAARSNDRADVFDTVQFRDDTERALVALVDRVNGESYVSGPNAESALRAGVADWDAMAAREQAATGRAASVTVTDIEMETTVSHTNASRVFVNTGGGADWTLVDNVDRTDTFVVTVSPDSLVIPSNASDPAALDAEVFHVEFVDGSDTYQVFVFKTAPATSKVVVQSSGSPTLETTTLTGNDPFEIDFVAGTVDGTAAPALSFAGTLAGPTSVGFENGDTAAGTYELVVDGDVANPTDYATDGSDSPTAQVTVLELEVSLSYRQPTLDYQTPITVSGGGGSV